MSAIVTSSLSVRFGKALKSNAPAFGILALLTGCASPNNAANPVFTRQQADYDAPLQPAPMVPVRLASADTSAASDATSVSLNGKIYHVMCAPEGTKIIATDRTLISHGSKADDPAICLTERVNDGLQAETLLGMFVISGDVKLQGEKPIEAVISQETSKASFHVELPAGTSDQGFANIDFSTLSVSGKIFQVLEIRHISYNIKDLQSDGHLLPRNKTGDETIDLAVDGEIIYAQPLKRIVNENPGDWKPLIPIDVFFPRPISLNPIKTASR